MSVVESQSTAFADDAFLMDSNRLTAVGLDSTLNGGDVQKLPLRAFAGRWPDYAMSWRWLARTLGMSNVLCDGPALYSAPKARVRAIVCPREGKLIEQAHDALVKRFAECFEALQAHASGLCLEAANLVHRRRQGRIVLDQSLLGRNAVQQ